MRGRKSSETAGKLGSCIMLTLNWLFGGQGNYTRGILHTDKANALGSVG